MPAVSVLMPAFNVAPYLGAAIESVLAQSYRDWELVIVNDGSTDETQAIADRYAAREPGRLIVRSQPNRGIAAARNTAIHAASGECFALLDSDDTWDPSFLSAQMAILDACPEVAIVTGNARYLGGPRYGVPARPFPDSRPAITLAELIRDETAVFIMSVFRRGVNERIGGFDESLRTNEDYDFWLRAASAGFCFARNATPLACQRRRDDSLSADDVRMITGILKVYRKLEPGLTVGSPERRAVERQIVRFEAEALAAQARRALLTGDVDEALIQLAHLRARRSDRRLRLASAVIAAVPETAAAAYRASIWLRSRVGNSARRTPVTRRAADVQGRRPLASRPGGSTLRRMIAGPLHAADHALGRFLAGLK